MAVFRPVLRVLEQPAQLAVVLAVWLGSAWFFYNLSIEFSDRMRGDAVVYWGIADAANSLWEVMAPIYKKPPGFPMVVYLLKSLASELGFVFPQILNFIAVFLFLFHLASCLAFFMAMRRLAIHGGFNLPIFPLCLLFIHPGLISYTTVLLTDTFTVDLLMIGLALFISTRWVGRVGQIGLALLSGLILGFCVLVRVTYGPPLLASLVILGLIVTWKIWRNHYREQEPRLALLGKNGSLNGGRPRQESGVNELFKVLTVLVGFGLAMTPSILICYSAYGKVCIQNTKLVDRVLMMSVVKGLDSPRYYWSKFAPPPEGLNRVIDPFLAKHWASECALKSDSLAMNLAACYLRKPHIGAIFVLKKILAVFDHYYLQPYAVDRTPRWVRIYSRLFGAVAFAGFIGAAILFGIALRRPEWPHEIILITAIPICIAVFQSQLHVEGRFGFGALVGTYFALGWLWAIRRSGRTMGVGLICTALGLAGATFLIQTSYWDVLDPALRLIEKWS